MLCFSFWVYPNWCENNIIGIGKLSTADGKAFADPEVLRRLTSSVSCALDEAAAALTRMRAESTANAGQSDNRSLAEACSEGDVNAVRKLLIEGRSVNEHTEEGESLLCLACSAGYYELAQVCIIKIKLTGFFVLFCLFCQNLACVLRK